VAPAGLAPASFANLEEISKRAAAAALGQGFAPVKYSKCRAVA
jgi:hypothetical protein